jgi:hypothetical protein
MSLINRKEIGKRCSLKHLILIIFLSWLSIDCGIAADMKLSGSGIGPLLIGAPPGHLSAAELVSRKWEMDENGASYEIITITLKGKDVEAEIYDGRVWRISISERGISTLNGISVGDNALAVLRGNKFVTPEIGPGQIIVLISNNPCGLSYITDAEVADNLRVPLSREMSVPMLRLAKIKKIIASGCQ